jgi:heptosyltransferase-2
VTARRNAKAPQPRNILVVQTAFLGDLILTLPLIQGLDESFPDGRISVLAIPSTLEILHDHPAVDDRLVFDKRGRDRGWRGLLRTARRLRGKNFDTVLVPHRSLRSALLVKLAGIPRRIGFDASAGSFLLTDRVRRDATAPETRRNLDLLTALGLQPAGGPPRIHPGEDHRRQAGDFLNRHRDIPPEGLIGVAPGSAWPTKRWLAEGYAEVIRRLQEEDGRSAVLLGGREDGPLCREIARLSGMKIPVAAGELSVLSAAALMERCRLIVTNDSAAAHLAAAVGRPVVAIFGPTVPAFGFTPSGSGHIVLETDLECRPCGVHGGNRCPRRTFACMRGITPEAVLEAVRSVLESGRERSA